MTDKGNECTLSFSSITELTAEEEHERVTELEIIFGLYEAIDPHALRRCTNIQKITMINCRLQCIPNRALCAVRESLVHLCLSSQTITRMDPLDLPNLRALYLQQNRIERIEGLDKCRRLQILWLYGNCLTRVENLGHCTDLRELWLQDNALQSLTAASLDDSGLENLVNLETLCVAKNRIRAIDELQALRKLINLRSLSFSDDHFGSNPIVRHPEYRAVAIATLRQMQTLDGGAIDPSERAGAVDQFLSQALAFNDTIAELTLQYEQDLRAIETRRQRGESNATMLQRELIEALNEVEQSVVRGTEELEREKQRHTQLRTQHSALTVEAIANLREQYQHELDDLLAGELSALDEEELYYEVLEQEAEAEHSLALTVATLQSTFPATIASEILPEHSPDFQHILSTFETGESDDGKSPRVLQIVRFHHDDLVRDFDAIASPGHRQALPGDGSVSYLFCAVTEDEAMAILQHGFTKTAMDAAAPQWLALFSDPVQALTFNQGRPGSFVAEEEDRDSTQLEQPKSRIQSHLLLLCQVFMAHVSDVTIGDATSSQMNTLQSLIALATVSAFGAGPDQVDRFIHTTIRSGQADGDLYITRRDTCGASAVLPQFVVLCSHRASNAPSSHPKSLGTKRGPRESERLAPEQLLTKFAHDVDAELLRYHARVWKELEPAAWTQALQFRRESKQVDREASQLSQRIGEEKKLQRKVTKSAARARK